HARGPVVNVVVDVAVGLDPQGKIDRYPVARGLTALAVTITPTAPDGTPARPMMGIVRGTPELKGAWMVRVSYKRVGIWAGWANDIAPAGRWAMPVPRIVTVVTCEAPLPFSAQLAVWAPAVVGVKLTTIEMVAPTGIVLPSGTVLLTLNAPITGAFDFVIV